MTLGSLRDQVTCRIADTLNIPSLSFHFGACEILHITLQVIYPDTQQQMATKGWTDDDLLRVMDIVTLSHIIAREGGWDSKADWKVKSKQINIFFVYEYVHHNNSKTIE